MSRYSTAGGTVPATCRSVLSFACLNDVEDCLVTADYAAIEAVEAEFADSEASEFRTVESYSVINRLAPELATQR